MARLSPFCRLSSSRYTVFHVIALLAILSLLIHRLSTTVFAAADSHFEGFEAEDDDEFLDDDETIRLSDLHHRSPPPSTTLSHSGHESHYAPPDPSPTSNSSQLSDAAPKPSAASFDYWDEDEFEGLPVPSAPDFSKFVHNATTSDRNPDLKTITTDKDVNFLWKRKLEISCVSFLVVFLINYIIGRRENEKIALAWAGKFAGKDSIFEKNFSLLGIGEGEDSPLLMKEGQNVFKFYASGRRFCQGILATLELQSRHDLIARLYNMLVPCRDEISFEVYMNDEAMDQVVFALAKKKAAKEMHKEEKDLQKFASMLSPPSNRKWISDDLAVISESKDVAADLITEAVLDQVFGEKAYEKFGKGFISMQFSDQCTGSHKKMLMFKFVLPDADHIAELTRLVALVPYYIDFVGRYKLSPQARVKTEAVRYKLAQEAYRELQNARQEALQKKKAEMKDLSESQLTPEARRKKEEKEKARQLKRSMPKVKMARNR